MYGALVESLLWPLWEGGVRRRPTPALLAGLLRSQWRSLDELTALQGQALQALARQAFEVPFYRRRFVEAGLGPDDLRTVEDLARLPVVTRDELRDAEGWSTPRVEIRKSTSGTMGKPLVFGYERRSEDWRQAVKLRGYRWAGYRPGRRALHYWGAAGPARSRWARWKTRADHALKRERYLDCGRRGPTELDAAARLIAAARPQALLCYSQAGGDLARHVNERGLRRWGTIPVLCGAERLTAADRQALEAAFGPEVYETYGCREVMLIATECPAHQGLHVSMENLIVELLVDDGGRLRAARPGELGQVVVTDLHNLAQPFIRYANGDLAVAGPQGACPCGRHLSRLASVEGRVTETLTDRAGRRINGLVFNVVIAHLAQAIRQFQVVQRRDRSITLRLVPTASFGDEVRRSLEATCARYLPETPVSLELVDEIATGAAGKRRVVVVEA